MKLLSLFLVLSMVLSFAPTAFAAESEAAAPADEEVYGSSWGDWDDWEDTDPDVAPVEDPAEDPAPVEEPAPAEEPVIEPVGEEGTIVEAVEDLPVADARPANTFFYVGGSGLRVTVEAPEGAFPIDAEMTVKEVRELKDVQDKIDVSEFAGKQAFVAADISFTNGEGEEIQPDVPVKVNMKDSSLAEVSNAAVLHLDNDGALSEVPQYVNGVLQPLTSFSDSASFYVVNDVAATQMLSFEAESFSTYIIIGEVIIENEEDSFDFETDEYVVTVSYTAAAQIPFGTKLVVSQIPYDSEEYWDLWEQSLDKLNENVPEGEEGPGSRKGIASAVFFDISLIYNGEEIEPAVPLQVNIAFKQGGLPRFEGEQTKVIHFGDKGTELIDQVSVGATAPVIDGMPDGAMVNDFTYVQDGFSKVGVFTTDEYVVFSTDAIVPSTNPVDAATLLAAAGGLRAAGEDRTINATKTLTDQDQDGISELALTLKATSKQSDTTTVPKSNVVMVIDVSGSMADHTFSEYTYDQSTYNRNNLYYTSTSVNDDGKANGTRVYYNVQRQNWYTTQNPGSYTQPYTGTVYQAEARLDATKRAANAVVDALMAYNNNKDYGNLPDVFEITVVKFSSNRNTSYVIRDSRSADAIKTEINRLSASGGTNWERALQVALTEANYFKNTDSDPVKDPTETTSVIFLTDGFPTYYGNDQGYSDWWDDDAGYETDRNIALCYSEAHDDARAIVQAGFPLYNIFAFGSSTPHNGHTGFQYMQALTNYAHGGSDTYSETPVTRQYCFNATSTDALVKAFQTIVSKLTNNIGYAGVDVTDGVSLGATSTSIAVNGTPKADTMRYTVLDDKNMLAYTVKISNGTATFYGPDQAVLGTSEGATVTTTINGEEITTTLYSVVVGTGENAKEYKMSPATINAQTGMVEWNLAALGILESGYTYQVAFDVWPNQIGYDIVADMNNGKYTSVEAALDAYGIDEDPQRQQILDSVKIKDGSYVLYTNYKQRVEYYPATATTDESGQTTWEYGEKEGRDLDQPDPIPLTGSNLSIKKTWESSLSPSELDELLWKKDGSSKEYGIKLYVWKAETEAELNDMIDKPAGEDNVPYQTVDLGWDKEKEVYVWEQALYVAPGMMMTIPKAQELGLDTTDSSKKVTWNGTEYLIVEPGHYYYVTEDGGDLHFELETEVYHPMIVGLDLYDVTIENGEVKEMDPMSNVLATNYLKGGLNISKVVSSTQIAVENGEIKGVTEPKEDGVKSVEDEFAFEVKLWKEEDGKKTPVYTYDDQIASDGSKTISGSIGYRVFSKPAADGTFGETKRGAVLAESSPYASLANGIFATISDTETTIVLTMPANGEIRLVNLPAGTQYSVKEIVEGSAYTYAATKSQAKDSSVVTTDNTVTGKISGNTANIETYYNWAANFYVYHSGDNTVEKISFTDPRVKGTFADNKYTYTFDIANETKSVKDHEDSDTAYLDFLYGGYYKDYAGKLNNGAALDQAGKFEDSAWAVDVDLTGGTQKPVPYTGNTDTASWATGDAFFQDPGTAMHPEATKTYYLKEVPANKYLQAYTHYTYYLENFKTTKMWEISNIDDVNYRETGFVITKNEAGKLCRSLTVKTEHGDTSVKLTAQDVFRSKKCDGTDFLTYLAFEMDKIPSLEKATIGQYWITPDNVLVTSTAQRVLEKVQSAKDITATDKDPVDSVISAVS